MSNVNIVPGENYDHYSELEQKAPTIISSGKSGWQVYEYYKYLHSPGESKAKFFDLFDDRRFIEIDANGSLCYMDPEFGRPRRIEVDPEHKTWLQLCYWMNPTLFKDKTKLDWTKEVKDVSILIADLCQRPDGKLMPSKKKQKVRVACKRPSYD